MIKPYYEGGGVRIYCADAVEVLRSLPDGSVGLIATDPPYYRVKGAEWDRQWKTPALFIDWIGALCAEWRRVLKPNGSLYVFASPEMAARVEVKVGEFFNVLNRIRWEKDAGWHRKADKESLRSYLSPCEHVIFAEQYGDQYGDASRALHKNVYAPLGHYIQQERERAGLTRNDVEVGLGYVSGSDPSRGTALCYRWEEGSSLPTAETYQRLRDFVNANAKSSGEYLRREYEDLRREYEDLRRPFNVSADVPHTDLWTFKPVAPYPGKHECEKPLSMMRHIIQVSSRPGDAVLDCFAGSGVTGQASAEAGRPVILVDKSEHWCGFAAKRLSQQALSLTA